MEMFKTILAGVSVFIFGQIILKLLVDPVQEMKKVISKVRMEIIRTSYILHNSESFENDAIKKVFDSYRELSASLLAGMELVPLYPITRLFFGLPSPKKLNGASTNLIALSNWMMVKHDRKIGHIIKNADDLIDNLGLKVSDSERVDKKIIDELIKSKQ